MTRSSSGSPSLESVYGYDEANRLTSLAHSDLVNYTWTYDATNDLETMNIERFRPQFDLLVDFTYDDADQLTGATSTGNGSVVFGSESYEYDDNGNRKTPFGQSSSPTGENNRVLSDGTYRYAYDDEGHRTAKYIDLNGNRTPEPL